MTVVLFQKILLVDNKGYIIFIYILKNNLLWTRELNEKLPNIQTYWKKNVYYSIACTMHAIRKANLFNRVGSIADLYKINFEPIKHSVQYTVPLCALSCNPTSDLHFNQILCRYNATSRATLYCTFIYKICSILNMQIPLHLARVLHLLQKISGLYTYSKKFRITSNSSFKDSYRHSSRGLKPQARFIPVFFSGLKARCKIYVDMSYIPLWT